VEEIYEGRAHGKNIFNPEDREAEVVIAWSLQNCYNDFVRKKEIENLQDEIVKKASKLDQEKQEPLRIEYMELAHEEEALINEIDLYKKRQLGVKKSISSRWVIDALDGLLNSFKEDYYVEKILRNIEKAVDNIYHLIDDRLFVGCRYPRYTPGPFDKHYGKFDEELRKFDELMAKKTPSDLDSDVNSTKNKDPFELLTGSLHSDEQDKDEQDK
jgi:hypothetical protein